MSINKLQDTPTAYSSAFNRGDIDQLISFYEEEAVFVGPGGNVCGKAAIGDLLRAYLAQGLQMSITSERSVEAGDIGLLINSYVICSAAGEVILQGRSSEVLRKGKEAQWRFVIDDPTI
jgi:ketosteroid isomerase-like protein